MRSAQLSTLKTSRTAKCSKADSLFATRFAATPGQLPKPSAKTARHILRSVHGPRDRQQRIEREQAAYWQIKRATRRSDLDVSANRLKRDSTFKWARAGCNVRGRPANHRSQHRC